MPTMKVDQYEKLETIQLFLIICVISLSIITLHLYQQVNQLKEGKQIQSDNSYFNDFLLYNYSLTSFERALTRKHVEDILHESGYISFIGNQPSYEQTYWKKLQLQKNIYDISALLQEDLNEELIRELTEAVKAAREKLDDLMYTPNLETSDRLERINRFFDAFNADLSNK
ncbi:hypothetical protein M3212_03565 [Alkalihalobacillus oceani]|uniref:hypothetical protein n=1 Tax=Halalkalibacter oceani TaxID=1653776 RepID=UPI0020421B80|nr:hypothetical protein [Halalkalibacter oceani]MCM3759863.1 hypothetical protein [Halalkalibacter oceani]